MARASQHTLLRHPQHHSSSTVTSITSQQTTPFRYQCFVCSYRKLAHLLLITTQIRARRQYSSTIQRKKKPPKRQPPGGPPTQPPAAAHWEPPSVVDGVEGRLGGGLGGGGHGAGTRGGRRPSSTCAIMEYDISLVLVAARNASEKVGALCPPALDGIDDSEAVVCACSHALRVAERVSVGVEGTCLPLAVLKC